MNRYRAIVLGSLVALFLFAGSASASSVETGCQSITLTKSPLSATIYLHGTTTVALGPVAGNAGPYAIPAGTYDVVWSDGYTKTSIVVGPCEQTTPTPTPTPTASPTPSPTPFVPAVPCTSDPTKFAPNCPMPTPTPAPSPTPQATPTPEPSEPVVTIPPDDFTPPTLPPTDASASEPATDRVAVLTLGFTLFLFGLGAVGIAVLALAARRRARRLD